MSINTQTNQYDMKAFKGNTTLAYLLKANFTLEEVLRANTVHELDIPSFGPKRYAVLRMFRMANKNHQVITKSNIQVARGFTEEALAKATTYFTKRLETLNSDLDLLNEIENPDKVCLELIVSKSLAISSLTSSFALTKEISMEFITNEGLDGKIAKAFEHISGEDLTSSIVGQVASKFPRFSGILKNLDAHDTEKQYRSLIFSIINGLQEAGFVQKSDKIDSYVNSRGYREYTTQRISTFPGQPREERELTFGIHKEPNQVPIKKVKAKNGGKSFKYGRREKDYLGKVASQELQLVDLTVEQFYAFCEGEKWYTTESDNFDTILKNKKIDLYWDAYQSLMDQTLFLSMRTDYRTRALYNFTNTVFGVHTKGGKYLWEARHATLINEKGQALHIKSAITIYQGRVNTTQSIRIWETDRDNILEFLSTWDDTKYFGENIYNQRLAQAIIDTENKIPTKFLLMVDLTNMGLISNASEFRDPKTMIAANISNNPEPQDSHMILAKACECERDVAKELGQGVYHGQSIAALVKSIEEKTGIHFTQEEIRDHLAAELGQGILNISKIAEYTRDLHDNHNPSLFFSTIDSWKAQSIAYAQSVDYRIFGLSNDNKKGFETMQVTSDLPIKLTLGKRNQAVHNSRNRDREKGERKGSLTKNNGGYANIAHSIDAWMMRVIVEELVDKGYAGVQIYDNYCYSANALAEIVIPRAKDCFKQIRAEKPYARSVEQMRQMKKGSQPNPLTGLYYGDAEFNPSSENNYFSA